MSAYETTRHRQEEEQRFERRISAAVSVSVCALTIVGQISITLLLTSFLRENAGYVYLCLEIAAVAVALWVYQRPGSPSYKLAWMCLLTATPVPGMILFCLWGGTRQSKRLSLKYVPPAPESHERRLDYVRNLSALRGRSPAWGRLAAYLMKRDCWLFRDTTARYFPDGAVFFQSLIADIRRARRYVFLEYYILAEGRVWDALFSALRERAAAGVEICIIFDDFGNLFRFSGNALKALQDAHIGVEMFNPVHRYIGRVYFNYRDHRKIAVIDGETAYTGGINLADEYANLVERFGHWKDSAVRLHGPAAWGFAAYFIQLWKMLGRALRRPEDEYRPGRTFPAARGYCQPFADGPLRNPDCPIEETYLQLISSAQKTLYMTTPYYAVEESMQTALCIAADAGVDVRLCVPAIPDHKLAYLVAETYWGQLLRHGVRIYRYAPGFLHAKSVLADGEVALVGSTNMDYRTFQLHHECGVLLYHMPVIRDIRDDLERVMEQSERYTLETWEARPWTRRLAASVLKLGAIWL
ncbi:MAG: cardiolipin synthase [Oscillibacter sp.]|nr:cardiolipin synthase [Oscillibacter sp.]